MIVGNKGDARSLDYSSHRGYLGGMNEFHRGYIWVI